MKLLLLSNSTNFGAPYLEHGAPEIASFLENLKEVLFIPYAAITISYDDYERKVQEALSPFGIKVNGIHHHQDASQALKLAEAIMVGGGNTFRLLSLLQEKGLIDLIRKSVKLGIPYVGWSAGSNIAGPTIKTTNDMPVDQPQSFDGLNLVPFQINPHFTREVLPNHNGETRLQRLMEFTTLNPNVAVIGLQEGTWIEASNDVYHYHGKSDYLFMKGEEIDFRNDKFIKLS